MANIGPIRRRVESCVEVASLNLTFRPFSETDCTTDLDLLTLYRARSLINMPQMILSAMINMSKSNLTNKLRVRLN